MANTLLIRSAVSDVLAQYAEDVDREVADVLARDLDHEWLRGAVAYHLGRADVEFRPLAPEHAAPGGKKLRPALALLSYLGVRAMSEGPDGPPADLRPVLPLAAALELIHNYSLAHDDIEDDDRCRRGRPTLWTLCGKPKAINAGDCLHALAFRCLSRSRERGVDAEILVRVLMRFAETSVHLTAGQSDDLSFEDGNEVSTDAYLRMIAGKTAALISCATYCGALLAVDASFPDRLRLLDAFDRFGKAAGLGFQICDDVLGIWGVEAETGKPSGSDIRRRKKSLPVLFALERAAPRTRGRLHAIYSTTEPMSVEDEAFVRSVLDDCGARPFACEQADGYKQLALSALADAAGGVGAVAGNPFLTQLSELASFMTDRSC